MFFDELTPILRELTQQPLAFVGGFLAGAFRLNLSEDPVKSWLDQQTGVSAAHSPSYGETSNGRSSGPQTISIE